MAEGGWFVNCVLAILLFSSILEAAIDEGPKSFTLKLPHVKPKKNDDYLCTSLRIDPSQEYYVTGYEPLVDMSDVHHLLIMGCEEPASHDEYFDCGSQSSSKICGEAMSKGFFYLWNNNTLNLTLPKDLGFKIGKGSGVNYFVLQAHFLDAEKFKDNDVFSDAGVRITFTSKPKPKVAFIQQVSAKGSLPPKSISKFESVCKMTNEDDFNVFAFRVHAHSLGRVISGYKVTKRRGREDWTLIGKEDPRRPQMFYPAINEVVMRKDDYLAVRCTFDNQRNVTVETGIKASDEMCMFYIMYWTTNPKWHPANCHSMVNRKWHSWHLTKYPDEAASSLTVNPSERKTLN